VRPPCARARPSRRSCPVASPCSRRSSAPSPPRRSRCARDRGRTACRCRGWHRSRRRRGGTSEDLRAGVE
jgi:hypothetical protein